MERSSEAQPCSRVRRVHPAWASCLSIFGWLLSRPMSPDLTQYSQWTPRYLFFQLTTLYGGGGGVEPEIHRLTLHLTGRSFNHKCDGCERRPRMKNRASASSRTWGVSLWGAREVDGSSSAPRYLSPSSLLPRPGLIPDSNEGPQ